MNLSKIAPLILQRGRWQRGSWKITESGRFRKAPLDFRFCGNDKFFTHL